MKKGLKIVIRKKFLSFFLLFACFFLPLLSFAQAYEILKCCKLDRDYNHVDPKLSKCVKDKVVGPPGGEEDCKVDEITNKPYEETEYWGTCCLLETIYDVTDWIFYILLAIVVLLGIISGILFMTAGGDPGKVETARKLLIYLIVGLVVAVMAKMIPSIVLTVIA